MTAEIILLIILLLFLNRPFLWLVLSTCKNVFWFCWNITKLKQKEAAWGTTFHWAGWPRAPGDPAKPGGKALWTWLVSAAAQSCALGGEQSALQSLENIWQVMEIRCWEQREPCPTSHHSFSGEAIRHRWLPPNLGWTGSFWCLIMSQQANLSVALLHLCLLGATLLMFSAHQPWASSGRGCASPTAAVPEEDTLMFLLVVHLETPLRWWRHCPCAVKTSSQLLCFFSCSLF